MWQSVLTHRIDRGAWAEAARVPEMQITQGDAGLLHLLRQDGQEKLVFERVRLGLDAALRAASASGDFGAAISRMRTAVVEARSAVGLLGQAVSGTSAGLAAERRQLEDAERRGRLAAGIGDRETVDVAQRFAVKHAEKLAVLERKLAAQQDELAIARRELAEMVEQLDRVEREQQARGGTAPPPSGGRFTPDEEEELLRSRMDRAAKEAKAAEQLEALKRRMGR